MANIEFFVPKLKEKGLWMDDRSRYPGGYGWRWDRPLSQIKKIAQHHSVTNPTGNARQEIDTVRNIHKNNGWGGIGYNFIITSEEVGGYAKVSYVGDIGTVRAHTINEKGVAGIPRNRGNEFIIGICLIGQLHINLPTEAQIRSANLLVRELIFEENQRLPLLTDWESYWGHYDFDRTACPGRWSEYRSSVVFASPPVEEKPPVEVDWRTECKDLGIKHLEVNKDGTGLIAIDTGETVKRYNKKDKVDIRYQYKNYYITEYSYNNKIKNGFRTIDLSEETSWKDECEDIGKTALEFIAEGSKKSIEDGGIIRSYHEGAITGAKYKLGDWYINDYDYSRNTYEGIHASEVRVFCRNDRELNDDHEGEPMIKDTLWNRIKQIIYERIR